MLNGWKVKIKIFFWNFSPLIESSCTSWEQRCSELLHLWLDKMLTYIFIFASEYFYIIKKLLFEENGVTFQCYQSHIRWLWVIYVDMYNVYRNKCLNCKLFFKSLSTVQQSLVPPKPEIIFCGKTASFFGSYFLANMYIMITFKFTAMKFILININCLWVYCDHFLYYNLPKILFPKDVILLFILTW